MHNRLLIISEQDLAQIILDSCETTLEQGMYPDTLQEMMEANLYYIELGVIQILGDEQPAVRQSQPSVNKETLQ